MSAPDPQQLHPVIYAPNGGRVYGPPQVTFLRPLVQSPFTQIGEYTYYADPDDPTCFERNNLLYHHGPDRLIIGKFCALARGTRFIMGAANHQMGLSTYPFPMFGGDWIRQMDLFARRPMRGDTVVGNDVWFGHESVVLPGVRIGDGAIIGAQSVVGTDVPPYTVFAGNPARQVRRRFSAEQVERLLAIVWWDWPIDLVTRNIETIMGDDVAALETIARTNGLLPERTPERRAG